MHGPLSSFFTYTQLVQTEIRKESLHTHSTYFNLHGRDFDVILTFLHHSDIILTSFSEQMIQPNVENELNYPCESFEKKLFELLHFLNMWLYQNKFHNY